MLRKIKLAGDILREWSKRQYQPGLSCRPTKYPVGEPGSCDPLSKSGVERYKTLLLEYAPITYGELFPEEKNGIRIPGIKFSGQSPNACVAAYWHVARAEQFLNIYLEKAGIEESERKKYREIFSHFNDLAFDSRAGRKKTSEGEDNINTEILEKMISEAVEAGLDRPLLYRLTELAFKLLEKNKELTP